MTKFLLTDELRTGISLIDSDHRELADRVNELFDAMESGAGGQRLRSAMDELIAYTSEHFGREEAEMRRIDYVAALAHQAEHAKLLKQVIELKKVVEAGGKLNVPALIEFLDTWLHEHILDADMKLAAALKRAGSAEKLAQAH